MTKKAYVVMVVTLSGVAALLMWGQTAPTGLPPSVQACTGTVTTSCTPQVNGAGAFVPPVAGNATIAATTDLLSGDGAGNASDSTIVPASVCIPGTTAGQVLTATATGAAATGCTSNTVTVVSGVLTTPAAGGIQITARSSDPGCTTASHLGKIWFNNTTTTTALEVCVNVAGTVGWTTVTLP